jgi:hypothetical protein
MAEVTVESILSRDLPQAVLNDYGGYRPTEKVWTREYPATSQYTIHPPTATGLDTMFHPLDVDDALRRESTCFDINDTIELHRSEGDTVASWRVQVTHPVSLAFQHYPLLLQKSEVESSPNSMAKDKIVDYHLSILHNDSEQLVVLGELKRWGAIEPEQ